MYCQILLDSFSNTPPDEMAKVVEQIGQENFSNLVDLMKLTCTLEKISKSEKLQELTEVKKYSGKAFDELFNNQDSSYSNTNQYLDTINEDYDALYSLLDQVQKKYCPHTNNSYEER